jgi:hypothetical protein
LFPPGEVPEVLEIVGWYDGEQAEEVHRAALALSKGDMERLLALVVAAVDDFRDVLMWASLPEPAPEELAAGQARNRELVRWAAEGRRRYLESAYGARGADQVERSNQRLFGKPERPGPPPALALPGPFPGPALIETVRRVLATVEHPFNYSGICPARAARTGARFRWPVVVRPSNVSGGAYRVDCRQPGEALAAVVSSTTWQHLRIGRESPHATKQVSGAGQRPG